jgi:hypothetical protein
MRWSGSRAWSGSGSRVLWVVGAAWLLAPVLGVVDVCRAAHFPAWVTWLLAVVTVALCALLAVAVLAVTDPGERERREAGRR